MPAWGDERWVEEALGHGARNSRLADAKSGCYILRTDQSVQDVCWGNASYAERSPPQQRRGLGFREWRRHFVVQNMQSSTRPFGDFVPDFSLRRCVRGPSERNRGNSYSLRTSPP